MSEPVDFIEQDPFDPELLDKYEAAIKKQESEAPEDAIAMLERRRRAYARVFTPGERDQGDIDTVLADLMWFCKTWVPTYDIRDGIHAERLSFSKEGRREVFQRIKHFSRLGSDALLLLYTDVTTK